MEGLCCMNIYATGTDNALKYIKLGVKQPLSMPISAVLVANPPWTLETCIK